MNLKKYIVLPVIALTGLGLTGCSSDFLDKIPLDQQTEATAFKTSDNFKNVCLGII